MKMQNKPIRKILGITILLVVVVSGIVVGAGPVNNASNRSSVDVSDSPELYVYPTYLDFGVMGIGETAWDSFSVWNEGEDTLEWEADWDMSWIDVYPSSGSLWGGESHEVDVEIDTTDLEGGETYDGYIYLTSNGGDAEVYVEVEIDGSTPIYYHPVASFTYTYLSPITIMFDASPSYDNDGFIIEYNWDFGDDVTGTGITYNHTYIANGTYNVKLTVTDNDYLTDITTWNVTISNVTAYDVCDFVNDIGIENLTLAHVSFLIDLFIGLNSSVLDQIPPEHRPNGIIKNPTEDDVNAVGAYYCGNIVFGNYYANKSLGRVCCESNTTGLVLARKNSSVEDAAQKVAIGKEWKFLAVNTKDPVDIKQKIKAEYDKEPFEYLLIVGNDTEIPLEDKWELIYSGDVEGHVLDSLYYGNMNNDSFVEISAGRIPFDNESAVKSYFDNFKVKGTQNYYVQYPIYNTTFEKVTGTALSVEWDNTTMYWSPTKENFTNYLGDAKVFSISTHGWQNGWSLGGDSFTKSDIPDIRETRPVVISDTCLAAQGLGVDFLKAGASAFIGQYFITGGFGIDGPFTLNKKILNGNSIGNSVRDYLNYQIASSASLEHNETIINIDIHNFTIISDSHIIAYGDPSLKIPPIPSNLESATIERKDNMLVVKIPEAVITTINNSEQYSLVLFCYGGENEVKNQIIICGVTLKIIWDEIINEGGNWKDLGLISQLIFPIEDVKAVKSGVEVINESSFELEDADIPFISLVRGESMDFLVIYDMMLDPSAFFNQREIILNVTVSEKTVFDTEAPANPYPSISGIHNGTIKPNQTITVNKLYTYSCAGTGGHTEYARIWNNSGLDVNATWNGYTGDWHNITFNETFVLYGNKTYNYTIRTGSYPRIHHNRTLLTSNGWINCTEFTDANGKKYGDWIPAIKFF